MVTSIIIELSGTKMGECNEMNIKLMIRHASIMPA